MGLADAREGQMERVLATARELFTARGFEDVTMAEIAEQAGVARATVFNYFGSKHALVEAITEEVISFYRAMLDLALADDRAPTPAVIRKLFEQMGEGIEEHRRFFRGVFREIARIQLGLDEGGLARRANGEAKERLLRLVEQGQERGELNAELEAHAVAAAFHALVNGTITDWLYNDPTESLTARMRRAAEVFLSSVEDVPLSAAGPRRYDRGDDP